jgi:hypothetical protein
VAYLVLDLFNYIYIYIYILKIKFSNRRDTLKEPLYRIKSRRKRKKKNDSSINSGLSIQGMGVRYIGSLIGPQDWRELEKNVRFFTPGPMLMVGVGVRARGFLVSYYWV